MVKKRLGRGLNALFGDTETPDYFLCPIEKIYPNRFQPRENIDTNDSAFQELMVSIKEKGILQPLLVTPKDDGYELIAGERRLKAALAVGLKEVPVIVRENISEAELLELSLIENIQREDLTPIEEAEAYYRLMKEFHLTQEEIAKRVGKDRTTIANFLRLRQLPDIIKKDLVEGRLTMGHARALLGLPLEQQLALREEIINKNLSVRAIEKRAKTLKTSKKKKLHPIYSEVAEKLTEFLGTKVKITPRKKGGVIEIVFYSEEGLFQLLETIVGEKWSYL
ncbi:MAG: ParB/RepB/Spo0J family partition protein [Candidatus Desulfofervidus auxilii]|nr:ParB/RepB/Spo0J family partition protein [Candidatus Desulfofervidus auxilii]